MISLHLTKPELFCALYRLQPWLSPLPSATWGKGITQEFECCDTVETKHNSYRNGAGKRNHFSKYSEIWMPVLENALPGPHPAQTSAKVQGAAVSRQLRDWLVAPLSARPAPLQLPAEVRAISAFCLRCFQSKKPNWKKPQSLPRVPAVRVQLLVSVPELTPM